MNIAEELLDNQILLSIFSKLYYNESVLETLKGIKGERICYVTLNKTASSLEKVFRLHGINTRNIFFIDAVSWGLGKKSEDDNVLYVSSPAALSELSIALTESLKSGVFDLVMFDSLSTLNIYDIKNKGVERFTSHIINKVKSEEKKGIFTCLEDDMETTLIKNALMYIDKAVRFTDFYHTIERKKHNHALAAVFLVFSLGIFSFFDPGRQLTGYVVSSAQINPNILFVLLFVSLGGAFLLFYKNSYAKPVPKSRLLKIRPVPHNRRKLKMHVKHKINRWFRYSFGVNVL